MTRNTFAERRAYVESPLSDGSCARKSKSISAISSTGSNVPLCKAIAFVDGVVLTLYSAPCRAV